MLDNLGKQLGISPAVVKAATPMVVGLVLSALKRLTAQQGAQQNVSARGRPGQEHEFVGYTNWAEFNRASRLKFRAQEWARSAGGSACRRQNDRHDDAGSLKRDLEPC
jgi:hypothetical protein